MVETAALICDVNFDRSISVRSSGSPVPRGQALNPELCPTVQFPRGMIQLSFQNRDLRHSCLAFDVMVLGKNTVKVNTSIQMGVGSNFDWMTPVP